MSEQYVLYYADGTKVIFSDEISTRKYLNDEANKWSKSIKCFKELGSNISFMSNQRTIPLSTLGDTFNLLENNLGNPANFNRILRNPISKLALPPPSKSIEGQLIFGLVEDNQIRHAFSVYIGYINSHMNFSSSSLDRLDYFVNTGHNLILAAHAVSALPFKNFRAQQLTSAVRVAEDQRDSLLIEVEKAQKLNIEHTQNLKSFLETTALKLKRIESIILRRERNRRTQSNARAEDLSKISEEYFKVAHRQLASLKITNDSQQKSHQEEFQRLLDLFHTQLRLKAPVQLWRERTQDHGRKARAAIVLFGIFTTVAIILAALIPFYFGDYISQSFFINVCNVSNPTQCSREFSAKGPLTASGILIIMSLILWTIRLQFRVYLSERHLSLDASEKEAFVQTYLAMKEGQDVGTTNEAIVLASLFRPTQDGIIKDDEGTLDLSAAAILARQLGRT